MGATGKSFQDRQRSAKVRNLALDHLEKILDPSFEDIKYQREVLLRLAPNLLPRLSEVTGADGKDLPKPIFNIVAAATDGIRDYNSDKEGIETE